MSTYSEAWVKPKKYLANINNSNIIIFAFDIIIKWLRIFNYRLHNAYFALLLADLITLLNHFIALITIQFATKMSLLFA